MRKTIYAKATSWFLLLFFLTGMMHQSIGQTKKLTQIKQITNDNVRYSNATWSPDGSMICFTGEDYTGLYLINANGANKKTLATDFGAGYQYKWAADNSALLYRGTTSNDLDGEQFIASVDVTGKREVVSKNYSRLQTPIWNYENGKKQALFLENDEKPVLGIQKSIDKEAYNAVKTRGNSDKHPYFKDEKLFMVNSSGVFTLVNDQPSYNVVMSPDGKKIAFNEVDELVIMNCDGTGKKYLGYGHRPSWVNNNQLIYEVTQDNGHEYTSGDIYLINIDGKGKTNLTNTPNDIEMYANCAPDGKRVVFMSGKTGQLFIGAIQ